MFLSPYQPLALLWADIETEAPRTVAKGLINVSNFYLRLTTLDEEYWVKYPKEVVLTDDPELLCSCLCKYVIETMKQNG